MSLMDEAVT